MAIWFWCSCSFNSRCFIYSWVLSILNVEFSLSTIAAVLTIAGYSINDTVVIFDRVRENLRKYKNIDLIEVFNMSINNTLSRTVMTSITTLLALILFIYLEGRLLNLLPNNDYWCFNRYLFIYFYCGPNSFSF